MSSLYGIVNLLNKIKKEFSNEIESIGLTFPKWIVIKAIKQNEHIKASGVQEITSMDKATLSELINRLVKEGYITKEVGENDKRCFFLATTPKVDSLCLKAIEIEKGFEEKMKSLLSDKDVHLLKELIKK